MHEQWGSVQEVTLIDTNTGSVANVSGHRKGAWLVLDVSCDLVVAQFACLNACPALVSSVCVCVCMCVRDPHRDTSSSTVCY